MYPMYAQTINYVQAVGTETKFAHIKINKQIGQTQVWR